MKAHKWSLYCLLLWGNNKKKTVFLSFHFTGYSFRSKSTLFNATDNNSNIICLYAARGYTTECNRVYLWTHENHRYGTICFQVRWRANTISNITYSYYRLQRSCGKVMFLHLSVILSMGWMSATHPLGRYPSCAVHAGIRSTSGRYASYWNAFLLLIILVLSTMFYQVLNLHPWFYWGHLSVDVFCFSHSFPFYVVDRHSDGYPGIYLVPFLILLSILLLLHWK